METKTFTEQEVSEYLGDPIVTDDHSLASIDTCIRVIGRHDVSEPLRNVALVQAACASIESWCGDFGVNMDFDVDANDEHDEDAEGDDD